jgi:hypothetical protein
MSGTGNWVDLQWKDGASHPEAKVWDVRNLFLSNFYLLTDVVKSRTITQKI